jgi:death-on-curing protein
MSFLFLTLEEVLKLHHHQIETYGGAHGLRDQGLVESALAQPAAEFGGSYLHADVFEMAAAYLYHLVQNHPFYDGNKRIGAACAHAFLYLNGYFLVTECADPMTDLVLLVAQGKNKKTEVADFFRKHSHPFEVSAPDTIEQKETGPY